MMRHLRRLAGLIALWLPMTGLWAQQPAGPAEKPAPPPAYLVVTGWYKDLGVQKTYTTQMSALIRAHGLQASVIGMPGMNLRVLEGDWAPRLTILAKFPSEKQLKEFWWSDAYRGLVKIRADDSLLDIVRVNGAPGSQNAMAPQSAYLMFHAHLQDRKKFMEEYRPYAPAVVEKFGGRFIIFSARGDTELLEGNWHNMSLIVIEFPTKEAMTAFWTSAEYQRLSEIRKATGKWSVVEITPANFRSAAP